MKDLWDKLSEEYAKRKTLTEWILGYKIVKELLNPKGKKVLDYGCGGGTFTEYLRNKGAEIIGVDISKEMIKIAKKESNFPEKYHLIEKGDLSLIQNDSYDAVILTFVLCVIKNNEEIKKVLKNSYSKLKINGKLITLEPHPNAPGYQFIDVSREKHEKYYEGMPIKVNLKDIQESFHDYWRSIGFYKMHIRKTG